MTIRSSIPVYARGLMLSGLLLGASQGLAQTRGVFLPPAPSGSGGEDSVETESGARCRQSINSNGAYVDLGVVGSSTRVDTPNTGAAPVFSYQYGSSTDALGYARVTIPLGKKPKRLDCSKLYELEIARLKRELEMLSMAAE